MVRSSLCSKSPTKASVQEPVKQGKVCLVWSHNNQFQTFTSDRSCRNNLISAIEHKAEIGKQKLLAVAL